MVKEEMILTKTARLADIVLASGGMICLIALSYFVYYYAWTGQRQFSNQSGMLLYYVCPALMAALLFASLRLQATRKINIALFLCSLAVSIYSGEIAMTLWFNLPSVQWSRYRSAIIDAAKAQGVNFDSRTKSEVIDDLHKGGIDAVPSISPQVLLTKQNGGSMESVIRINGVEVLPLASIADKSTVVCNESGQFLTYTSDEHGFNNPANLWKTDRMDVIALGDSFVQGWCVSPKDNFVALIRERYPATVNLGIEGDGPLTMLATMKEYGERFKPKVVLWFFYEGNDLADLRDERLSPLLTRYLTNGFNQGLMARQAEIDRALSVYVKNVRNKSKLMAKLEEITSLVAHLDRLPNRIQGIVKLGEFRNRLGLVQGRAANSLSEADRLAADDNRARSMREITSMLHEILLKANEWVSAWGGKLYFVYLPALERYDSSGPGPNPDRDRVLHVARALGLPIIDIHEDFIAQRDPLGLFPFHRADHYTEKGHRLVADEVLRAISVGR